VAKLKSRKAQLLRMLEQLGEYRGIECFRTPGEEAAVRIAMSLIEVTSLKDLDYAASRTRKAEPFWSKQW
jgi:hypothetical protein